MRCLEYTVCTDYMEKGNPDPRKIIFVINPVSGGVEKHDLKQTLKDYFGTPVSKLNIIETGGDNDEERIRKYIQKHHPETVFVVGGDGTVNLLARILMNQEIRLGIIPMGSANGLATDLEIPGDPVEALNLLKSGRVKKIDLVKIGEEHISVHISDIGLNAKIVKRYSEEKSRGMIGYARQFFREVRSAKPGRFEFSIGDRSFSKKAHMVAIANASRYGTGANINPVGKPDDGLFEVCIFKPYPWWAIFRMLVYFLAGKLHKLEYVDIRSCKHARIENKSRYLFQVDGEPMGNQEVIEPEIIPGALRILIFDDQSG